MTANEEVNALPSRFEQYLDRRILAKTYNIDDLRLAAKSRLPAAFYHLLEGGSDNEYTLAANRSAFDNYCLVPDALRDVSNVDLSTTLLGESISMPLMLSPTGCSRSFHHTGERAVAAAASNANIPYALSNTASTTLEDVAQSCSSQKWFQLYVFRDRGLIDEFIQRCRAANYHALCLTVDVPIVGNRERDLRTAITGKRYSMRSLLDFATHPRWTLDYLRKPPLSFSNLEHHLPKSKRDMEALAEFVGSQFDASVDWHDAARMAERWGGPFVVKGILSVEDARKAREIGAKAIVVSNHGGRQLDCTPSPMTVLAEIIQAVGGDMEIIVEGGVRRGTDIIKALCLGATACSIGRPYLYGLAAAGEAGVHRALEMFKQEMRRNLMLMGCTNIAALGQQQLRSVG